MKTYSFNSKQEKRFADLMSVQTVSHKTAAMTSYIKNNLIQLIKDGMDIEYLEDNGNIYVTKGKDEFYPCYVAHTDTVHRIKSELHLVVSNVKDGIWYSGMSDDEPSGIGGDDKVGIFIILEMLSILPSMKAAFFRDEEVGCLGSMEADMPFFADCSFLAQIDRQGSSDVVTDIYGQIASNEFIDKMIEPMDKYKRAESDGLSTDVAILAMKGVGVSCINISCGYYLPHTADEYVVYSEVIDTMHFCVDLAKLSFKRWVHDFQENGMYKDDFYEDKISIGLGVDVFCPLCNSVLDDGLSENLTMYCKFCEKDINIEHALIVRNSSNSYPLLDEAIYDRYGI